MPKSKAPTLNPPFVTKKTRMQGKRVIKVSIDKNAITVEKEKEPPSIVEDDSGYSRVRVFDSWES